MKTILVTGANGQVGQAIQDLANKYDYEFTFADRETLDISNRDNIEKVFQENQPDFVVNCAAYTQVDLAETERESAKIINTDAVELLTKACQLRDIPFIHISSDYVYHPDHDLIMTESEQTTPQGIYALTKLEGDQNALNYSKSIVLRTSWVYAKTGKNFVNTIANLARSRPFLSVVSDQIGSPTYAPDIAEAIMTIIEKVEQSSDFDDYGIYHFSNDGFISWFDFAQEIARINKSDCTIAPCPSSQYPTPAKRPLNSKLSKQKFESVFTLKMKPWKESLSKCLKE